MTESEKKIFEDMDFAERMAEVDERISDQPGRIKTPHELLELVGQTMYIVISPQGQEKDLGTCFLWEWPVGRIADHHGGAFKAADEIDLDPKKKYLCYSSTDSDKGISLRDYNIIPNNYNNHAVFGSKEAAEAYILFRKLQFPEDDGIARLNGEYDNHFTEEHVSRFVENEKKMAAKTGS